MSSGDERLATFFEDRFRKEFVPAFEAWLALPKAEGSAVPPGTPFSLPDYQLSKDAESQKLAARATAAFSAAKDANQTGDNFVLAAVLFASVLFFAGISTKFESVTIRGVMIGLALVTFLTGAVGMLLLPQNVGI